MTPVHVAAGLLLVQDAIRCVKLWYVQRRVLQQAYLSCVGRSMQGC